MCNLYLNVVMCMVWCEVVCGPTCGRFDVNYGDEVKCGVMYETWCDVECCSFRHGAIWNATEIQNV